jgi:hypothetical protein
LWHWGQLRQYFATSLKTPDQYNFCETRALVHSILGWPVKGRSYHWDKWGNCLTENSVNFFLINDFQRCLVYPFMLICLSNIKLFQSYNSQPFRMLLYVGVHEMETGSYRKVKQTVRIRFVWVEVDVVICHAQISTCTSKKNSKMRRDVFFFTH